jgi:hypothetical protein
MQRIRIPDDQDWCSLSLVRVTVHRWNRTVALWLGFADRRRDISS